MRTLELFAGIGGMRLGLPAGFEVVAAFDQDREAARVYAANHQLEVDGGDLASVRAEALLRHHAEAWLLSPPCQPFTRRGARRDVDDSRAAGFLRLIELLPKIRPRAVLVENVVGFHGSRAHALLVAALVALGHEVRDVALCPSELGAPVRRPRAYVVSRAGGLASGSIRDSSVLAAGPLADLLDREPDVALFIPPDRARRLDGHVAIAGRPLATFTRSYGRAIRGAGPVLATPAGLRYLSPGEILHLHGFPPGFSFPAGMPLRTRLRLACNSVHVGAVAWVALALAAPAALRG